MITKKLSELKIGVDWAFLTGNNNLTIPNLLLNAILKALVITIRQEKEVSFREDRKLKLTLMAYDTILHRKTKYFT